MNEKMMIKAFNITCKEYSCGVHIEELGAGMYAFVDEKTGTTLAMGTSMKMNDCMREFTNEISIKTPRFRDSVRNNLDEVFDELMNKYE